jgi:type VI secretion system protein ImpF
MPQLDLPTSLLPSLKDRLLDPDSMGTKSNPGYTLGQLFDSVREDLEELLNTRRSREIKATEFAEVAKSIAWYGMPDLTSFDTSTPGKQEAIGPIIEKIITQHEPRLRNVRATLVRSRGLDLRVLFHIDAELCVDPSPKVSFETVVELMTGQTSIREKPE